MSLRSREGLGNITYEMILERKHWFAIQVRFQKREDLDTVVVVIKSRDWSNYNHIGQALNTLDKKWNTTQQELIIDNLFWKSNRLSTLYTKNIDEMDKIFSTELFEDYFEDDYYDTHNYKVQTPKDLLKDIDETDFWDEYIEELKNASVSYLKCVVTNDLLKTTKYPGVTYNIIKGDK